MSTIERLSISNIRSFGGNASDNIIEFYKPLTVIVGHNGAGKTVSRAISVCLRLVDLN
jgi:DNA repair protein RAD50